MLAISIAIPTIHILSLILLCTLLVHRTERITLFLLYIYTFFFGGVAVPIRCRRIFSTASQCACAKHASTNCLAVPIHTTTTTTIVMIRYVVAGAASSVGYVCTNVLVQMYSKTETTKAIKGSGTGTNPKAASKANTLYELLS